MGFSIDFMPPAPIEEYTNFEYLGGSSINWFGTFCDLNNDIFYLTHKINLYGNVAIIKVYVDGVKSPECLHKLEKADKDKIIDCRVSLSMSLDFSYTFTV